MYLELFVTRKLTRFWNFGEVRFQFTVFQLCFCRVTTWASPCQDIPWTPKSSEMEHHDLRLVISKTIPKWFQNFWRIPLLQSATTFVHRDCRNAVCVLMTFYCMRLGRWVFCQKFFFSPDCRFDDYMLSPKSRTQCPTKSLSFQTRSFDTSGLSGRQVGEFFAPLCINKDTVYNRFS